VIALAGAVWGAWAAFWPNERLRVPADAFALFAFAVTGVAMLAHLVILRVGDGRGPPAGLAAGAAILVALAWATKLAALGPLAALAPALVGLALLAHSFLPRGPDAHSALAARRVPFGPGAAARMLLFPAVAAAVYGAFAAAGAAPATNIVFYLVSVPLGFVLLLAALVRAVRGLNARPRQAG
jgi:hypothetical protein